MIQKIMLALEINDEALDKAQAKADKLVATLQQAEALQAKLDGAIPTTKETPLTDDELLQAYLRGLFNNYFGNLHGILRAKIPGDMRRENR